MGERTVTTVYLVRHAEAEGNLYRIAHGQYNGLITDRGYQQLHVLKKRFDDVHIDAVYSSDLFRARTTARAVYEPKGLELHLEPAFREIHMGCWEGRPWQELNTAYEEQMFYFNRQLDKFHVEGSETAQQVLDRYIPALKRVAAENDGKTIAIFSHGAAMRMVLGTLNGLPLSQVGETPHGDNTAVSLLEIDGDDIRVVYMNDNSHQVEAGLSTFAKQTWWRDKRMMSGGQYYKDMDEATAARFGVPAEGKRIAVIDAGGTNFRVGGRGNAAAGQGQRRGLDRLLLSGAHHAGPQLRHPAPGSGGAVLSGAGHRPAAAAVRGRADERLFRPLRLLPPGGRRDGEVYRL